MGEPTIAAKPRTSLAILNNEIVEVGYKSQWILPIVLEVDAKIDHDNERQTYHDRNSQLDKQCGHTLYMIQGQCM